MIGRLVMLAVVLAVVITAVGILYSVVIVPPESVTPTSTVPEGLRILGQENHIEATENVTFFVVTGVVQNNHTSNVCYVNVTSTYYDAMNETIAERIGYTVHKIVKPRQNSPFEIYFLTNSSSELPARYELVAEGLRTNDSLDEAVVISDVKNRTVSDYYEVSGTVENTGSKHAYSVKVLCAFYNAQGGYLGLMDYYVGTKLYGGISASFNISSAPIKMVPATYELFVTVHHYEIVPITNLLLLTFLILVAAAVIIYMKGRKGW